MMDSKKKKNDNNETETFISAKTTPNLMWFQPILPRLAMVVNHQTKNTNNDLYIRKYACSPSSSPYIGVSPILKC